MYVNPTSKAPSSSLIILHPARARPSTTCQEGSSRRGHGQRSRRQTARGQGDDGGRRHVPVQDARRGRRGAAGPPGPPAPRVRGGAAARRPRPPARPRRAAQAREALLPRPAPPRRRLRLRSRRRPARAAQDVVRRAARRRQGAAREPHALAPHHVRHGGRDALGRRRRRRQGGRRVAPAVVLRGRRGRRGAAADTPAQGRGGAAHEGEQGRRRGRRQDHAALRRQGPGRRSCAGAVDLPAGLGAVEQEDGHEEREADEVCGSARRDHRMTKKREKVCFFLSLFLFILSKLLGLEHEKLLTYGFLSPQQF